MCLFAAPQRRSGAFSEDSMSGFRDLWSMLGGRKGSGTGEAAPRATKQEGWDETACVTIGTQVWLSRNLNVATFRNGDPIPEARTPEEWIEAGRNGQPAWCFYQNDPSLGATYGRLYNWFAVVDKRALVPRGWHVPADQEYGGPEKREFTRLIAQLDGGYKAGSKLKESGTTHWKTPNNNPADNQSGFTALPGGTREKSGEFWSLGSKGHWWTTTPNGTDNAYMMALQNDSGGAILQYTSKMCGLSVSCVRD
jgi:uncharacterized protein (TIGR02145 family)